MLLPGAGISNVAAVWFLPVTILMFAFASNQLLHLTLDSLRDGLPPDIFHLGSPGDARSAKHMGYRMRFTHEAILSGFFPESWHDWASPHVDQVLFGILEIMPWIVMGIDVSAQSRWRVGELYAGYMLGLLISTNLIAAVFTLATLWAIFAPPAEECRRNLRSLSVFSADWLGYYTEALLRPSGSGDAGPHSPAVFVRSASPFGDNAFALKGALFAAVLWTAFELALIGYIRIVRVDSFLSPTRITVFVILYIATFLFWAATLWRLSVAAVQSFPTMIKGTFVCAILAVIAYGAGQSALNAFTKFANDDKGAHPVMTVHATEKTLATEWERQPGFEPYPICRLSWGGENARLSALDLGAISVLAYEEDCKTKMPDFINRSFARPAIMEHCAPFAWVPRTLVVYFPPKEGSSSQGTRVVAVKGTNTPIDVSMDSAIYGMLSILSLLSTSVAPVLDLLPHSWLTRLFYLSRPDFLDVMLAEVVNLAKKLQDEHPEDRVVLTGHSLGGMFAAIAAAQTGLDALVWSAPGNQFLARAFQISLQRAKKYVVIMPDSDVFPRVDVHMGVLQKIECRDPEGNRLDTSDTIDCHSPRRSVCEVWRTCGDADKRHFHCSAYFDNHWLGREYPDEEW
eukprot:CAMPEP_0170573524 /NCGR_PEP_ID=MMETSP0224-20130122/2813_1 /TAXON_ID=285029 /ORGANISM="Togula jolla, Strain CCCM 725" /LENGTH=626 /DNA_ID=CAMNT_0010896121 /DNA_START=218 /DNA_END=2098 /DNA_ORIENTATION=+